MTRLPALLLLAALSLTGCANTATMKYTPGPDGETVTLPKHHLAVTVPNGWRTAKTAPANTLLFAAANNGNPRFVIVGPLGANDPGSKDALVANAAYQKGIQRTLAEGGFTKIERSGMFGLAGANAFRCEASTRDKSQSILQVHVPYNNRVWVLSFYSTGQHISKVSAVPKILGSLQFVP
ncbi:MAG: hypothetical protein ACKVY0_04790 [Prosthecobacter sp.]|uniref:hypothetical protein n=1 Tax=Prosthecobacter sp. TaxID=1965333 RepID=UPI003901B969